MKIYFHILSGNGNAVGEKVSVGTWTSPSSIRPTHKSASDC